MTQLQLCDRSFVIQRKLEFRQHVTVTMQQLFYDSIYNVYAQPIYDAYPHLGLSVQLKLLNDWWAPLVPSSAEAGSTVVLISIMSPRQTCRTCGYEIGCAEPDYFKECDTYIHATT